MLPTSNTLSEGFSGKQTSLPAISLILEWGKNEGSLWKKGWSLDIIFSSWSHPVLSWRLSHCQRKYSPLPPSPQKMNHGAASNTFPSIMLVLWQLISWTRIICLRGKTFREFRIYMGITGAIGIWTSFIYKLDNIKLYLPSAPHPDPKVFFFSSKRS